jgi:hypothetical protein
MASVFPFLLPLALLACPLMMVGIGVGAWVIAKAKGEKKPLSMGCMMGQCNHDEHAASGEAGLKEQVSQLKREVQTLRAQAANTKGASASSPAEMPAGRTPQA